MRKCVEGKEGNFRGKHDGSVRFSVSPGGANSPFVLFRSAMQILSRRLCARTYVLGANPSTN